MDIISFNEAATANGRIESFIENPDSKSGLVSLPKKISVGESVTIPDGRVVVHPNLEIDGTLTIEDGGELFVPFGGTLVSSDLMHPVDTIADLRNVTGKYNYVYVTGYHAKNDGAFGSHIFRLKGVKTTETDNGGTVIIATIGGTEYVYELQYDGSVNVKWFGAKGDGIVDDTVAIQKALNSSRSVIISSGIYKATSIITIPKNTNIQGVGNPTIDFSSNTLAWLQTEDVGITQLPNISVNLVECDREITFSDNHNLKVGDLIVIYNPTDYSWSPARTYYRKGEKVKVAEILSPTKILTQSPIYDNYTTTSVNLYKYNELNQCSIEGINIICKPSTEEVGYGLQLKRVVDGSIKNVSIKGASYTCLSLNQCFDVSITGCTIEEDFADGSGGEYGIAIGNSQNIFVSHCYTSAAMHSIAVGGGGAIGDVVNYNILVNDCTITTSGILNAADMHGNTAYSGYDRCIINGSVTLGGKYIHLSNSTITEGNTGEANDIMVVLSCTPSCSFNIVNNTLIANKLRDNVNTLPCISTNINAEAVLGGVLNIKNNTFVVTPPSNNTNYSLIGNQNLFLNNIPTSQEVVINIENNTNIVNNNSYVGRGVYLRASVNNTRMIDKVNIKNNTFTNTLQNVYIDKVTDTAYFIKELLIMNNLFGKCYSTGLIVSKVQKATVMSNSFLDYLSGASTGDSTTNSAMYFAYCNTVIESSNITDTSSTFINARVGASNTVQKYYKGIKADISSQIDRNSSLAIIDMQV